MKKQLVLCFILATCAIGLSGCATTQSSQFYLLSSLHKTNTPIPAQKNSKKLLLGIGPINIPKYLNRPQVVTRTSSNALKIAQFHRWAEQLDNNITQVISENLSILLSTDQLKLFPWHKQQPVDYQLLMNVIQFDRDHNGTALLVARWSLLDGKGQQVSSWKKSTLTAQPEGEDYESLVKALSGTLAELSREIAKAITFIANEHR